MILTGCMSWVETGGQILDGSAFAEKTLALYINESGITVQQMQDKTGKQSLLISTDQFPTVKVRATKPDSQGVFYLSSLSFFCSSSLGWNEWTMTLGGKGIFRGNYVMFLHIDDKIVTYDIVEGKILHNTNRFIENDALINLKNRHDRINTLVTWMHEQTEKPYFANQKEFESYWKSIILPEIVAEKQRPQSWIKEAVFEQAEDIKWNKTYTASLFPQSMQVMRNSGALLRDWEEALDWIYFQYRWNDLVQVLTKDYNVTKLKG